MLLLWLLSYADRSILAVLSPTILHDLHLSATQYSWAITCFSLSYMLANPIWGGWMDRVGLFRAALIAVALWSIASGAHALVTGFLGLCIARTLLGFGEGATFPAGLKTVADTLPPSARGTGMAIAYSGGSLGAAITPLIVVPLAARFGWHFAFGITLAAGALWLTLWIALRTQLQPQISFSQSSTLLEIGPSQQHDASSAPQPRLNRNHFASAAAYGLGASPLVYGLYAAPLYLSRVLHVSQASLGHLLWLPPLGWEAGYFAWGRIADLRRAQGHNNPLRFFVAFAAAGILIPAIALSTLSTHAVALAITGFVFTMFIASGFVVFALSDGLARQQQGSAGFLAGFCISAWALATGILMPMLGKLFDSGHYTASLCGIACVPPVGVALWSLLRTRQTLIPNP